MKTVHLGLAIAISLGLAACGGDEPATTQPAEAPPTAPAPAPATEPAPPMPDAHDAHAAAGTAMAHVELAPTEGNAVRGSLMFTSENGAVRLSGAITGLEPGSRRGFHIHEHGDCSAPDAMSAGGHWNPTGEDHGRRSHGEFHAGDMDNLEADDNGNAAVDMLLAGLEIGTGSDMDVVGQSVIVHTGTDDYESQPTGDAGGRAACGVIEVHEG